LKQRDLAGSNQNMGNAPVVELFDVSFDRMQCLCGWGFVFQIISTNTSSLIKYLGLILGKKASTMKMVDGVLQYFSYIVVVSFIGGGIRSTSENHLPATSH
jgi:phosphate starvation-inducible membrane PsiE